MRASTLALVVLALPVLAASCASIVDFPDVPSAEGDGLSAYCDLTQSGAHYCIGYSNLTSAQKTTYLSGCTTTYNGTAVDGCPGGALGCCAYSVSGLGATQCYYCGPMAEDETTCANYSGGATWTPGDGGADAAPCYEASDEASDEAPSE